MKKSFLFAALVSVLWFCGCGDDMKQAEASLSADADTIIRSAVVGEIEEFVRSNARKRTIRTGDLAVCIFNEPESILDEPNNLRILSRQWTGMRVEKKIGSSLKFGKITKSKKGVRTCVIRVEVETLVTCFKRTPGVQVGMIVGGDRPVSPRNMEIKLPDERYDLAIICAMQPEEIERSIRMVPLRWDPSSGHWRLQDTSLTPISGDFANQGIQSFHEWGNSVLEREMQNQGMKTFKGVYFKLDDVDTLQHWADGYVCVNGAWLKPDIAQQTEAINTALQHFSRGKISLSQLGSVIAVSPRASNLKEAVASFVAGCVSDGDIHNFFGVYDAIINSGDPNLEVVGVFEKARSQVIGHFIDKVSGNSDADFAKKYRSLKKDVLNCKMKDSEKRKCFSAIRTKLSRLADLYRKEIAGFAAVSVNRRGSRSLMEDFRKSSIPVPQYTKYAELKDMFCIAVMFEYDHRYASQVIQQTSEDVRNRLRKAMACDMCKGEGRVKCRFCGGTGECRFCKGSGKREIPDFDDKKRLVPCPEKCDICHGNGWLECPYCGGDNFYIKGRGRVVFINTLRQEINEFLQTKIAYLEREIAAIDNDTVSVEPEKEDRAVFLLESDFRAKQSEKEDRKERSFSHKEESENQSVTRRGRKEYSHSAAVLPKADSPEKQSEKEDREERSFSQGEGFEDYPVNRRRRGYSRPQR